MQDFQVRYQPDGITCGPSCLGAVLDALIDNAPSTEEIAELCGTNPYTGTTDVAMKRGLKALGVSYTHPASEERRAPGFLDAALEDGNAVMLRTLVGGIKHWVTAHAVTPAGYSIACPVAGNVIWSREDTRAAWGARDYDCIIIPRVPSAHPELMRASIQESPEETGPLL
ncbi:hypothetical protein AB9K35_07840 [Leisingera sp. XS_AS12]|uniref:hypothetical protein n=1 Tax=Leisingera sp. XS_AS12 TaxID=3241294 RepID=UPI00351433C0